MQELENGEHGCTAEHIQWSIVNAFSGESNLSDGNLGSDILNILGFTSPKVKHLLNNICNFPDCSYLELGVWAGATYSSAVYQNDIYAIGIDNYGAGAGICPITFQEEHWQSIVGDTPIVEQCIHNVKTYRKNEKVKLYQTDLFEFDFNHVEKPINCFFVDCDQAPGEVENRYFHLDVINTYSEILADKCIFIKDDWNWTRHSTRLALEKLENYEITYEMELFTQFEEDYSDWWNGVFIALLEKK